MDDHDPLGSALRDRVRDEHPDLERLVADATRAGTRLRRRRRAATALGTAAAVTAVALVGGQLGGGASPSSDDLVYADEPSATPTPSAAAAATEPTTITLAELQRLTVLLREADQAGPEGALRLDELRRIRDAVRLAERRGGSPAVSEERTAAFEQLIDAYRDWD